MLVTIPLYATEQDTGLGGPGPGRDQRALGFAGGTVVHVNAGVVTLAAATWTLPAENALRVKAGGLGFPGPLV